LRETGLGALSHTEKDPSTGSFFYALAAACADFGGARIKLPAGMPTSRHCWNHHMRPIFHVFCLLGTASLLSGCGAVGIETATEIAARKEAEARAIGSACRHAVRSIEDCFGRHPKAGKAAVFAGWKDMDQYMRENEVLGMPFAPEPAGATPTTSTPGPAGPDAGHPSRRS
jgi:hypothetical protein